jgi:hypothetical protein
MSDPALVSAEEELEEPELEPELDELDELDAVEFDKGAEGPG